MSENKTTDQIILGQLEDSVKYVGEWCDRAWERHYGSWMNEITARDYVLRWEKMQEPSYDDLVEVRQLYSDRRTELTRQRQKMGIAESGNPDYREWATC